MKAVSLVSLMSPVLPATSSALLENSKVRPKTNGAAVGNKRDAAEKWKEP